MVRFEAKGKNLSYSDELWEQFEPIDFLRIDASEEEKKEIIKFTKQIHSRSDKRWTPPKPSSDAYIWRYLNFTQLLSILERDGIWFTNVGQFEDPYEGVIPKANLEAEVKEISDKFNLSREEAIKAHQTVIGLASPSVNGAYVNCWNISQHQSAALWEQYVDSPQGIAIRTTVNRLRQSLSSNEQELKFGKVVYIDYAEENIPKGNFPAIYHKRNSFEHEKEFRVSFFSEDSRPGIYKDVNTEKLIDQIVISPLAPDWFSELVELVLERYELDCVLKESGLYSDPDVAVK